MLYAVKYRVHTPQAHQSRTTYRMVVIPYMVQVGYKVAKILVRKLVILQFLVKTQKTIYTKDGNHAIKRSVTNLLLLLKILKLVS